MGVFGFGKRGCGDADEGGGKHGANRHGESSSGEGFAYDLPSPLAVTNASRTAVMTKSMTNQPRRSSPDLPKWVKPQLSKLVGVPPQGPEWLHEIKYDGYRMPSRLDR